MLRYVKSGMMLMSIAYIVLGLMLLIMPETSLLWICYAFGVVVLITGIVCLIQYARIRGTGFTAPFMLVGGVITAGLGIFTLAKPQVVTSFLPVVFGIFIVVDGLSRIGTAIDLAKRKGQKWWVVLLLSIVSLLCGALLACSQLLNNRNVDLLLLSGIFLLAEGILNLCCTIYIAMEFHALDRLDAAKAEMETAAAPEPSPEAPSPAPAEPAAEESAETDLPDVPAPELTTEPPEPDQEPTADAAT